MNVQSSSQEKTGCRGLRHPVVAEISYNLKFSGEFPPVPGQTNHFFPLHQTALRQEAEKGQRKNDNYWHRRGKKRQVLLEDLLQFNFENQG
jgi:hypothetical protein